MIHYAELLCSFQWGQFGNLFVFLDSQSKLQDGISGALAFESDLANINESGIWAQLGRLI